MRGVLHQTSLCTDAVASHPCGVFRRDNVPWMPDMSNMNDNMYTATLGQRLIGKAQSVLSQRKGSIIAYQTYLVRCCSKLLKDAINEVIEVLLVITDAVGMDVRSHAAQRIPKCQASCRAAAAACLRATRVGNQQALDLLWSASAHQHVVHASKGNVIHAFSKTCLQL